MAFLEAALPSPRVFLLPRFCAQHSTALVTAPIAKRLDVVGPLFAFAKQLAGHRFRSRLVGAIARLLRQKLCWLGVCWQEKRLAKPSPCSGVTQCERRFFLAHVGGSWEHRSKPLENECPNGCLTLSNSRQQSQYWLEA